MVPSTLRLAACFKIRRRQGDVDRLVTEMVVRRLSKPDAAAALTMSGDSDVRIYLEQLGDLRGRLDIAADQFASGAIDGAQLARITARLRPKLDVATAKVREARAAPDLLDLADPNIAACWQDLPIERKRAVIDALVTATIKPIGKTGRIEFDPEGVQVEWKRP
jgi:site-specific DNA recombinase